MGKRWTEGERETISYLLSFSDKYTYFDLSEALDRPVSGIRRIVKELDLTHKVRKVKSNGEEILFSFLKEIYPNLIIKKQYSIGCRLYLDLYIPDLFMGFEYDGVQHFEESSFFHKNEDSFIKGQVLDDKKDNICARKGINLIRIGYEDTLSKNSIIREIDKVGPGKEQVKEESSKEIKRRFQKEKYEALKIKQKNSEYFKSLKEKQKLERKEKYLYLKSIKKDNEH